MAYTMNRKLNEFKNLKQAILDGDFKNMAIEIVDSKYYM
jgi:hypothetical protein